MVNEENTEKQQSHTEVYRTHLPYSIPLDVNERYKLNFDLSTKSLLYPPEASGGYFGLASATPPPPRVERFSALTL